MAIAKIVISGVVFKASEKRFTQTNIPIVNFVMNAGTDEEMLVRVFGKGKIAERTPDLQVGDSVLVEGRLQYESVKISETVERKVALIDAGTIEKIGASSFVPPKKEDQIIEFKDPEPTSSDSLIGEDEIPF